MALYTPHKLTSMRASSSVTRFLVWGGGGGGARPPNVPTKKKSCTYIARASTSETCIFRTQIHLHVYNGVSFHYLRVWRFKQHYTDKTLKSMNIRESGASELRIFFAFSHSKTAISINILLVLQIVCLRNIFTFRSQTTSAYIMQSIQFPFIIMVYGEK